MGILFRAQQSATQGQTSHEANYRIFREAASTSSKNSGRSMGGCCSSRRQQAIEDNGEAAQQSAAGEVQTNNNASLSQLGSTERNNQRNNVVPIPEGLYTGNPDGQNASQIAGPRRSLSNMAPKVHNTKTVRSLVNLKKHTLCIHREDDSGKYEITFVADSTVPCRALIYVMAYEKDITKVEKKAEHPPRLKSKLTKREASITANLNGLEQYYKSPAGNGLPLESFDEEQLTVKTCSSNQVYPVVIRLQVALPPDEDSGMASQVQAQTTFATLVKQPDGTYTIQVLKQVLWVNGTSYVLHEIFGIDRTTEEEVTDLGDAGKECVICLAATRNTLALPCRHLCLCHDCAQALRYQSNKCPICRAVVQSLLQIKLGDGDQQNQTKTDEVTLDSTVDSKEVNAQSSSENPSSSVPFSSGAPVINTGE